jgi:hypothetical protein
MQLVGVLPIIRAQIDVRRVRLADTFAFVLRMGMLLTLIVIRLNLPKFNK